MIKSFSFQLVLQDVVYVRQRVHAHHAHHNIIYQGQHALPALQEPIAVEEVLPLAQVTLSLIL
jgi:hypothetical protein